MSKVLLLALTFAVTPLVLAASWAPVEVPSAGDAQDFSIDPTGRHLVVQGVVRDKSGQEKSFLQRHVLRPGAVGAASPTVSAEWLGHQGISVEALIPDGLQLWSSMAGSHGRDAARFQWRSDGTLSEPQTYTLFPPEFFARDSTMPKVCADGVHLVARGRTAFRQQFVAVFRLSDLLGGRPERAWEQALFRWPIDDEGIQQGLPVQGLSCAQDQVFVVMGGSRSHEPKRLAAFRLNGERRSVHVGPWDVRPYNAWASKSFEPEGLQVLAGEGDAAWPVMGVKVGTSAQRAFLLFTPAR